MMSLRQPAANRINAERSTGPKTRAGKARVAQNARRHGLALSVMMDPVHGAAVEALAHQIVGANSHPDVLHSARRVAEAQIDLSRIRQARHDHLARAAEDLKAVPEQSSTGTGAAKTGAGAAKTGTGAAKTGTGATKTGTHSSGSALSLELLSTLLAIDRYERRALSRRKFAIRELDAARHNN